MQWFGLDKDQLNRTERIQLSENCKPYSIKQIRTKYIVVSTDLQLEFFDVKAMTKIGNL